MPCDKASQPAGFFDVAERIEQLRAMQDLILRLHEAIDWELFRPTLEALVRHLGCRSKMMKAAGSGLSRGHRITSQPHRSSASEISLYPKKTKP
jgi:hypothetical protein